MKNEKLCKIRKRGKSERCKGHATEMLKLGTYIANDLEIRRVLVTCDKDNIASSKVIIKNGGVLENEVNDTDRIVQRYWIDIDRF